MDDEFESDYVIPELNKDDFDRTSSKFSNIDRDEVNEIYKRIDSVIDWIKQFYDRFRYLEEEFNSIRVKVDRNGERVSEISEGRSGVSVKVGAELQKLQHDISILKEKTEQNRIRTNEIERDKEIVQDGVVTNEIATMNRKVAYNLERTKTILAEVESAFSKIQRLKVELQDKVNERNDGEDRIAKSRNVLDAWKSVPGLRDDSHKKKLEPEPQKKEYKRLVDDEDNNLSSYAVGSKEWLKEVKRISRR